jgi:hypothetical protein
MYIEVGTCVWAYTRYEDGALAAVGFLASYLGGSLIYRLAPDNSLVWIGRRENWTVWAIMMLGAGFWLGEAYLITAALAIFGFSVTRNEVPVLAFSRSLLKIGKMVGQFAGMLGAFLVATHIYIFFGIGVVAALSLAVQMRDRPEIAARGAGSWKLIDAFSVFHQGAYFAYCFAFWQLLHSERISGFEIAFYFPIGWIAYWFMDLWLSREDQPFRPKLLMLGHLGVAGALILMITQRENPIYVLFAWFLTGLFGGTRYTMERASQLPSRSSQEIGASAGSLIGFLAMLASNSPLGAVITGCCLAACAGLTASRLQR